MCFGRISLGEEEALELERVEAQWQQWPRLGSTVLLCVCVASTFEVQLCIRSLEQMSPGALEEWSIQPIGGYLISDLGGEAATCQARCSVKRSAMP